MSAHMTATCAKCRRRFGWHGDVIDAPPCPTCGTRIDAAALAADQAVMDKQQEILAERPFKKMTVYRANRINAGLTMVDAIIKTGIPLADMKAIEEGGRPPTPAEAETLRLMCQGDL